MKKRTIMSTIQAHCTHIVPVNQEGSIDGGTLPYLNNINRWQYLKPESSARNTAKYVVS